MLSIDQRISFLVSEIQLWSQLLKANERRIVELNAEDLKTCWLQEAGGEVGISALFALEALVVSVAQLKDCTDAGRCFWPLREGEFDKISEIYSIWKILPFVSRILDGGALSQIILEGYSPDSLTELKNHPVNGAGLIAVFDSFCAFRRCTAKLSFFSDMEENIGVRSTAEAIGALLSTDKWKSNIVDAKKNLVHSDRHLLTKSLKRFLASEYLFPWVPTQMVNQEASSGSIYKNSMFEVAGLREIEIPMSVNDILEQQLDDLGVSEDSKIRNDIRDIFSRISEAILEIGTFDEVIRQVSSSGGQWGEDSMIRHRVPVNIIPSTGEDMECCEVLIAFARGKKARIGLRPVMRQVRKHLIQCDETHIVILFTDIWDKNILDESLDDIRAHREYKKKYIIGALVNGNQVTPQLIY